MASIAGSGIVTGIGASSAAYFLWKKTEQLRNTVACIPQEPFDESAVPSPPDYNDLHSWSAHPDRRAEERAIEDANHLALPHDKVLPPSQRRSDVFFVHDSCCTMDEFGPFVGTDVPKWNVPVCADESSMAAALAAKVNEQVDLRVATGACAFNSSCRVYAPRYRQAHVLAYVHAMHIPVVGNRWESASQAFELAYSDVRRAFVHFLSATGDRPFFVAGHSQGVTHLIRLVQEEIECHPGRLERFVHGYLVGMAVPEDIWGPHGLSCIRMSCGPEDVRSISSWRIGRDGHNVRVGRHLQTYYTGKGWRRTPNKLLSTNPVTWTRGHSGVSRTEDYLGAAYPVVTNLKVRRGRGAALRFGYLCVKSQAPLGARVSSLAPIDCGKVAARVDARDVTRVTRFPENCLFAATDGDALGYHDVDIAAFYGNIRENVRRRLAAWAGVSSKL